VEIFFRQNLAFDISRQCSPCVTTGIPAGFHLVFPCQPLTHIAPRLTTGIVPSPSPNFTPDLTSGVDPLTLTAESIHCFLASGKSSGGLGDVEFSHVLDGSDASHCA